MARTGSALVLGLCGASNGGKTTLAKKLRERNPSATVVIHQDDFYKEAGDLSVYVGESGQEKIWDVVEAIDMERLMKAVRSQARPTSTTLAPSQSQSSTSDHHLRHLVIVEGTMLLNIRELRPLLDVAYFLTLDHDTMRDRRSLRDYGAFHDPAGYFNECVWPGYMRDLKVACSAHHDGTVRMLDGYRSLSENLKEIEARIDEIVATTNLSNR